MRLLFTILLIIGMVHCKEKAGKEGQYRQDQELSVKPTPSPEVIPEMPSLVITDGSIYIKPEEDPDLKLDMKEISIGEFMYLFAEKYEKSPYRRISVVPIVANFKTVHTFTRGDIDFSLYEDENQIVHYNLYFGDYEMYGEYASTGIIQKVLCRNLEKPRKECKLFVKQDVKRSGGYPYFPYEAFLFFVKDNYLFYVVGMNKEGVFRNAGVLGFKFRGDDFPKASLIYLKNAFKIMYSEDKDFYPSKAFVSKEDIEFLLE